MLRISLKFEDFQLLQFKGKYIVIFSRLDILIIKTSFESEESEKLSFRL